MVRQKKQSTKKGKGTKSDSPKSSELPKIFEDEFRRAQHRFLFNVNQIEQKYCGSTSGLVMNLKNEEIEVEFDPKLCTAEDDDELIEMINQQQNNCLRDYIGDAQLSTPAPDPEQYDKKEIEKWKKLNKNFEASYEKIMKNEREIRSKRVGKKQKELDIEDGKENATPDQQKRCTALVKYEERVAAPPAAIQLNVALEASANFTEIGGLQIYGRFCDLSALLNPRRQISIKLPPSIKRKMLSIEGKISENKGKEEEGENLPKRQKKDLANTADGPSNYLSPKKSQSPFPLRGFFGQLVPFITIPETPLPKMADWALQKKGKTFRTTSNDEVVNQTPPEEFRRTLFPSQFNQTGTATPMNNEGALGSKQLTIADDVKLFKKRKRANRDFMVN